MNTARVNKYRSNRFNIPYIKRLTMSKRLLLLIVGVISLLALACGSVMNSGEEAPLATSVPAVTPAPAAAEARTAADDADSLQIPQRMVVRTIFLSMLVNEIPQVLDDISFLAESLGGFVVSSSLSGEEERMSGFITLRVPAENTDQALAQIRAMSVRVISDETQAQDVTEEYIDLQSRLRTLEASETQLLNLLERAGSVEEILQVQRELTNTRSQIEQIKGRTQYLERTSSTSLITVSLSAATSKEPLTPTGWSALETAKSAIRSLSSAGQGLVNLLIWVGIFSPFWLPVILVASFLVLLLRRRRKAKLASG